uniref:Uncharacterized protein n=1 Tax=Acrobeloides nanus TaxID=290746 RepID=A0A914C3P5_9BILA
MQISATNRSTGVTKSIYDSEQLQKNERIELPTDIHVGNQQMHGNNNECSGSTCFENRSSQVSMQQLVSQIYYY